MNCYRYSRNISVNNGLQNLLDNIQVSSGSSLNSNFKHVAESCRHLHEYFTSRSLTASLQGHLALAPEHGLKSEVETLQSSNKVTTDYPSELSKLLTNSSTLDDQGCTARVTSSFNTSSAYAPSSRFQPQVSPLQMRSFNQINGPPHLRSTRGFTSTSEAKPAPELTWDRLEQIQSDFVAELDELEEEFFQLAMLPNEPEECLQQKWSQTHLAMIPSRMKVLGLHGYAGTPEGHLHFTQDSLKLMRSCTKRAVLPREDPFLQAARLVFNSPHLTPLSNREMDEVMSALLVELRSEATLHDVQDLAQLSKSSGHDPAWTRAQFGLIKQSATMRVVDQQGLEEVEGWVRVMVTSQTWTATADRKLMRDFAELNQHYLELLGLIERSAEQ